MYEQAPNVTQGTSETEGDRDTQVDLEQKTKAEIDRLEEIRARVAAEVATTGSMTVLSKGRLDQLAQLIAEGNERVDQGMVMIDDGWWRQWQKRSFRLRNEIALATDELPA